MGVNTSALTRFYFREVHKRWFNFVSPVLGFLICMMLWLSLSWRAKVLGIGWMIIGLAYGAYNTRGFRRELVNLDIPDGDGEAQAIATHGTTGYQQ
jgi:hypothetical protein